LKNEAVCSEVQTHFGSSLAASFTEKVLGAIPRFMCPKMKWFVAKSDAFWTFSSCMLCKKSSGRIFPIFASKNEADCRVTQTHFGRSRLARFVKKGLGAFSRFLRPKTKLFAVKFRRILEVLCLASFIEKFWAQFHRLFVQK